MALNARIVAAFLAALLWLPAALAGNWQGKPSSGVLNFTATLAGGEFQGAFEQFAVSLETNTDGSPARLHVVIATDSANTHEAERDAALKSRDFFWVEQHPEARYQATEFKREGEEWQASGMLQLRGVTRPVTVRFRLQPTGQRLQLSGSAAATPPGIRRRPGRLANHRMGGRCGEARLRPQAACGERPIRLTPQIASQDRTKPGTSS